MYWDRGRVEHLGIVRLAHGLRYVCCVHGKACDDTHRICGAETDSVTGCMTGSVTMSVTMSVTGSVTGSM